MTVPVPALLIALYPPFGVIYVMEFEYLTLPLLDLKHAAFYVSFYKSIIHMTIDKRNIYQFTLKLSAFH